MGTINDRLSAVRITFSATYIVVYVARMYLDPRLTRTGGVGAPGSIVLWALLESFRLTQLFGNGSPRGGTGDDCTIDVVVCP
jgi:hypothetical protein